MAVLLRLADYARTTTYDLYSGTLKAEIGKWRPSTAPADGSLAEEIFVLVGDNTAANLISAENEIDDFVNQIERWLGNKNRKDSVWIEYNTDTESVKRSLIYSMELTPISDRIFTPLMENDAARYTLRISRHPFWELVAITTLFSRTLSPMSVDGEVDTFAATNGNAFARIARATVSAGAGALTEAWIGIREELEGTSGFTALIQIEDGTLGTDASLASETGASPSGSSTNNKFQVNFATATLVKRASIKLSDHTGTNLDHYIGNYKVLLRCKVDSGTTCGIQLKWNYSAASSFVANEEIYSVTNTSYKYIDLGAVSIPPGSYRGIKDGLIAGAVDNFEFQIFAERTGGSGDLHLDAIVLMPSDHLVYINDTGMDLSTDTWYGFVYEDDQREAIYTTGSPAKPAGVPETSFSNWHFPAFSGGALVVVGQRSASHVLTDTLKVDLQGMHRWRNHR